MSVAFADLGDPRQRAEIEAWVAARPDSTPFHRPAWICAVERATRNAALMLVERRGARIAGVLPLTLVTSPLFGRALVSSGFAVGGGILAEDAEAASTLAEACWREATARGCATAELRGGTLPQDGWAIRSDAYLGFSHQLAPDDDAQMALMGKRHRAELRKGLAADLVVETGRDAALLDAHYRLYAENVHRLGTPVFPKRLFAEIMDAFCSDADLLVVRSGGLPVTSVLTLWHRDTCMPYWQGASLSARTLHSNELAYFRLMGIARERGCTTFDFGRSKVGTGPAAWKKSWGWPARPLDYAVRWLPGREPRDVNPLSPRYARKVALWKRLPLPIANLVGPHIARGLG